MSRAALEASRTAAVAPWMPKGAARPALHQAMFALPIDVTFANTDTPSPLMAAFAELVRALQSFDAHPERRA